MDDSRQIGQSVAPVDSQAAAGSYYQPIGTGDTLPDEPVLPSSRPEPIQSVIPEITPVTPSASVSPLNIDSAKASVPPSQAVSAAAPPIQPTASASISQKMQTANAPKPKKVGLYLGIGFVVIVILIAVYFVLTALTGQKTTRSLNTLPPVETEVPSVSQPQTIEDRVLQPPVLPQTTSIAGQVCPTADGTLFFYNLDELLVYMEAVTADQTTYVKKLPVGNYVVFYQSADGEERIGYTGENNDNMLATVSLLDGAAVDQIDACNAEMDWRSVPIESYGLGEYEN